MVHHQCHRWKTYLPMDHVSWLQTSGTSPVLFRPPVHTIWNVVFYYELESHVLSAP
uniref:Uncharacterized protein n=1 Tax=Anguilla anguilla TaxID=7936 RepID=A0A0E9QV89_ANGAN